MKITYKKEVSLSIGQELYGIIAWSGETYQGVHPITVCEIDWNSDWIIFSVDQPCGYVFCKVMNMEKYVFETEEEAQTVYKDNNYDEIGEGLMPYYAD